MERRLPGSRNLRFDRLRILFATLVLLTHAPEITDGNDFRELFVRLTHTRYTLGAMGVDGFFLLSGYLIVRSWLFDPNLTSFLRKRILRIVPGYLFAVLISVVAVGVLAPAAPNFFANYSLKDLKSILLLSVPTTPPVLPGIALPFVNGSLWSIGYEFRCYVFVALFGLCGFFRRPWLWIIGLVCFAALAIHPVEHPGEFWHFVYTTFGEPYRIYRLVAVYMIGGAFWIFRGSIPFRPIYALVATVLLLLGIFHDATVRLAFVVCGGYLIFYFGELKHPPVWPHPFPDISYGIYLYGWPIEVLTVFFFHHPSPWITFAVAAVLAPLCGWLSWHFVERPMLSLKRHSAPLPPP